MITAAGSGLTISEYGIGQYFASPLGDAVRESLNPEPVNFFGLQVNPSFLTAIGVTAFILIAALILRIFVIPKFKIVPGRFQALLESAVSLFENQTSSTHGVANYVGPFVFTASAFIAFSTLVELLGVRPAFADINTCLAMGVLGFFAININGFKQKGVRRIKRYLNPINIVTDLSVPLSLSLRLFGSIMSGYIIMELLYVSLLTSIALPAIVSVVTTLFHALIQSFIFTTLTLAFIKEAVE